MENYLIFPFHPAKGPSTIQLILSILNRGLLGVHALLKHAKGIIVQFLPSAATSAEARQQLVGAIAIAKLAEVAVIGISTMAYALAKRYGHYIGL